MRSIKLNLVKYKETEDQKIPRPDLCSYELLRMACYPLNSKAKTDPAEWGTVVRIILMVNGDIVNIAEQRQEVFCTEDDLDLDLVKYYALLRNEEGDNLDYIINVDKIPKNWIGEFDVEIRFETK